MKPKRKRPASLTAANGSAAGEFTDSKGKVRAAVALGITRQGLLKVKYVRYGDVHKGRLLVHEFRANSASDRERLEHMCQTANQIYGKPPNTEVSDEH